MAGSSIAELAGCPQEVPLFEKRRSRRRWQHQSREDRHGEGPFTPTMYSYAMARPSLFKSKEVRGTERGVGGVGGVGGGGGWG